MMSRKTKTTATKEEATPALLPKLRFPGFRKAAGWERKEVGDVFQVTRGNVLSMTLVRDEKTEVMQYPVYSSQTKNNGLSGFYSDYLFADAITWTTDGANAGDVNYRAGKFFCTNVCGVLLSSKGFANPCVAALINSVAREHVSYVGNPKLMNGVMSKIPISLPSLAEQQKIAECLSSVDELITAQARKVDALKTHKKGLMQQLFPREGETQPRLRFPEFQNAGEWEELPLSKFFSHMRNGFVGTATPYYESNGIPYLQGKNIKAGNIDPTNLVTISKAFHEKQKKSQLRLGDILMVQSGHVGECAIVDKEFAGGNCHALIVMSPECRTSSLFFVHYFHAPQGLDKIASVKTGNTITHILATDLRTMTVCVPKLEEQQRIANCLTTLDARITAETQKHEALKTHKKGLMQQLFPSPQEVAA